MDNFNIPDKKALTRLQVLDIAKGYGNMSQYSEFISFFSNEANEQAIYEAFVNYGLPPRNADWKKGFWKFYCAARLYHNYPLVDFSNTSNCQKLKEISEALEVAKLNVDKENFAIGGGGNNNGTAEKLIVIADYQSKINGAYAGLSCATTLLKEQKNETLADLKNATEDSSTAAKNSSSNGIITMVVVVLVIVIIIKIFKR